MPRKGALWPPFITSPCFLSRSKRSILTQLLRIPWVKADNGDLYLQVDTYGSKERRMVGKKSQSIRFSPAAIAELKAIISKYF